MNYEVKILKISKLVNTHVVLIFFVGKALFKYYGIEVFWYLVNLM